MSIRNIFKNTQKHSDQQIDIRDGSFLELELARASLGSRCSRVLARLDSSGMPDPEQQSFATSNIHHESQTWVFLVVFPTINGQGHILVLSEQGTHLGRGREKLGLG